jgi:hypothetical protein
MSQSRAATILNLIKSKAKGLKKRYDDAHARAQQTPRKQMLREKMDQGWRP